MRKLRLENSEKHKLDIKLENGVDYDFTELDRDLITYDKASQYVTADANNATQPMREAKIKFTPKINGFNGDDVTLKASVRKLKETTITADKTNIDEENGLSFIVNVSTNARDFTLRTENDNIKVRKLNNKSFEFTTHNVGTSKIFITAQAENSKEKILEIPVNVRDESTRVSCVPEPGEYLMYVGEKRTWQFFHNASTVTTFSSQQNSGKILYHPSNRTFDITCNAVNGRQRFRVETQRAGSDKRDVIIFMTPIAEKPYVDFVEGGCYIPKAGDDCHCEVWHNLPKMDIASTNRNIVTSSYTQPYLKIFSHNKGKANLRFSSFAGKGGVDEYFKVLVDEPCVTFNGKLYPTFEAYDGSVFSLKNAEFQSGADGYVLEEADFFSFDDVNKKLRFKDIVKDEKYRIKLIPTLSGERLYENSSYITFVGVDAKHTELQTSHYKLAIPPTQIDKFVVKTEAPKFEVSGYDKNLIDVTKDGDEVIIRAKKLGDTQILVSAIEEGKLEKTETISISVTTENRKPEIEITPANPLQIPINTRFPIQVKLGNAKKYRFLNKRPDIVTFDRDSSELVVGSTVTTGMSHPLSYVEFFPIRDDIEGDMKFAEIEAIQPTPPTRIDFDNPTPRIYNNGGKGSVEVNVSTDAPDFMFKVLDKDIITTRENNKITFTSVGEFGTFRVLFIAKKKGEKENIKTLEVNVRAYPKITLAQENMTIKKCSRHVIDIIKNYPEDDYEVNNVNTTHIDFNKDTREIYGKLQTLGTDIILTPVSPDGVKGDPVTLRVVIEELPKPRIVVTPEVTRIYGRNPNGYLNFELYDCDGYDVVNERWNVVEFKENPRRFQRIGRYFTEGTANERCYLRITPKRSCDGARGDTVSVYCILMRSY